MDLNPTWYLVSAIAFVAASIALIVVGYVIISIIRALLPILGETQDQIRDIGDLSLYAVDQASATMDLVESRVSGAMSEANEAGLEARRQAVSAGSAVAGIYLVSRFVSLLKRPRSNKSEKRRR